MPKIASENDSRMLLQMRAAEAVAKRADRVHLSKRDSLLVLDLLQNPPKPNPRILASARALYRAKATYW
jgi:uncharacterized protein (DUF1778 family)